MCQIDQDCQRLYECINNICKHVDVFGMDIVTILTNTVFVFFVGLATCGNFGSLAIQVVLLMGALNYTRKESAAISQPLLIGVCFGSWMRMKAQKHPFKVISIIDYKLSCLLLPCLFAGLLGGIQMRNYLPNLILSVILVLQIVLMMVKTLLKYKFVRALEKVHQKVQQQVGQLRIIEDLIVDIADYPTLMTKKTIFADQEDTYINFHVIFKLISQSKHKDLYLKNIPPDLQEISFYDMDSQKEVKLKEYIQGECGNEDEYKSQSQYEDQLSIDNICSDKIIPEAPPINDSLVQIQMIDRDTIMSYHKYSSPYEEVIMMILLSALNLLNLAVMGGKEFNSYFGVEPCSSTYWLFFCNQFVLNILSYFIIVLVLKIKSNRDYNEACQEYIIRIKQSLIPIGQNKNSRLDIPITWRSTMTILFLGLSGGFLTGFIGVNASLLFIIAMGKLQANMQSLMATLPLMIGFSCLLGTLIQVLTGHLQWDAALFYGFLCFFGSTIINPIFGQYLAKIKFRSTIIKSALIFKATLLLIFLFIWIPTIDLRTLTDNTFLITMC